MHLDSPELSSTGVFAAELVVLSDDAVVQGLRLLAASSTVYAKYAWVGL